MTIKVNILELFIHFQPCSYSSSLVHTVPAFLACPFHSKCRYNLFRDNFKELVNQQLQRVCAQILHDFCVCKISWNGSDFILHVGSDAGSCICLEIGHSGSRLRARIRLPLHLGVPVIFNKIINWRTILLLLEIQI